MRAELTELIITQSVVIYGIRGGGGGENEEIVVKVCGFVASFLWIYTNEKRNVLLSRRSIPKQIKTLSH